MSVLSAKNIVYQQSFTRKVNASHNALESSTISIIQSQSINTGLVDTLAIRKPIEIHCGFTVHAEIAKAEVRESNSGIQTEQQAQIPVFQSQQSMNTWNVNEAYSNTLQIKTQSIVLGLRNIHASNGISTHVSYDDMLIQTNALRAAINSKCYLDEATALIQPTNGIISYGITIDSEVAVAKIDAEQITVLSSTFVNISDPTIQTNISSYSLQYKQSNEQSTLNGMANIEAALIKYSCGCGIHSNADRYELKPQTMEFYHGYSVETDADDVSFIAGDFTPQYSSLNNVVNASCVISSDGLKFSSGYTIQSPMALVESDTLRPDIEFESIPPMNSIEIVLNSKTFEFQQSATEMVTNQDFLLFGESFNTCVGTTINVPSCDSYSDGYPVSLIGAVSSLISPFDSKSSMRSNNITYSQCYDVMADVSKANIYESNHGLVVSESALVNAPCSLMSGNGQIPVVHLEYNIHTIEDHSIKNKSITHQIGYTIGVTTAQSDALAITPDHEIALYVQESIVAKSDALLPRIDAHLHPNTAISSILSHPPHLQIEMHIKEIYGVRAEAIPVLRARNNEAEAVYKLWIGATPQKAEALVENYPSSLHYAQNVYPSEIFVYESAHTVHGDQSYVVDAIAMESSAISPSVLIEMHVTDSAVVTVELENPSLHIELNAGVATSTIIENYPSYTFTKNVPTFNSIGSALAPGIQIEMHVSGSKSVANSINPYDQRQNKMGVKYSGWSGRVSPIVETELSSDSPEIFVHYTGYPSIAESYISETETSVIVDMYIDADEIPVHVSALEPLLEIEMHIASTTTVEASGIPPYVQKDNSMIVEYDPWIGVYATTSEAEVPSSLYGISYSVSAEVAESHSDGLPIHFLWNWKSVENIACMMDPAYYVGAYIRIPSTDSYVECKEPTFEVQYKANNALVSSYANEPTIVIITEIPVNEPISSDIIAITPGIPRTIKPDVIEVQVSSNEQNIQYGWTISSEEAKSTIYCLDAVAGLAPTMNLGEGAIATSYTDTHIVLGIGGCSISAIPAPATTQSNVAEAIFIYTFEVDTININAQSESSSMETGSHMHINVLNRDREWVKTIPKVYDGSKWAMVGYDYYQNDFIPINRLEPLYNQEKTLIGYTIINNS